MLEVERLTSAKGNTVELDKVFLIANGKDVTVGNPTIDGAKVIATRLSEGKGDKVIAFKYKPKVRYQRKIGHRQLYTKLEIKEILRPGEKAKAKPKAKEEAPKPRRRKAAAGGKS
jgi:large subunit ribosomal protein L21